MTVANNACRTREVTVLTDWDIRRVVVSPGIAPTRMSSGARQSVGVHGMSSIVCLSSTWVLPGTANILSCPRDARLIP